MTYIIGLAKGKMWKSSKAIGVGLLAAVVLTSGVLGYTSEVSRRVSTQDTEPFITNRVVTIRFVMTEEDWTSCQVNAMAKEYVRADFWFDGELVPDVAIRPKGHSSLRHVARKQSPRLSLKVDFIFFNSARTFRGLKKLNFSNGYKDPTLITERLAYGLFEQMDIPTPQTSFVDLWINDTHLGLYTQVEQVDEIFINQHFTDTTGNLYKPDPPAGYLKWTEADLKVQQPRDYLELMALKTNENYPDHSALFHLLDILINEPDETFPTEIEKVLDVDEVIRYLAVSTLIVHLDNYLGMGHNYYLYEVNGKFTMIPWDLNEAFGTFNRGLDREGTINFFIDEPTVGTVAERPLVDRLLSHQPYLDTYHGYLKTLLDGPFSVDVMESRINELADRIRPYVEADELKFFSTEDFERALTMDVGAKIGLKTFVVERSESVKQQLDGNWPSGSGDGSGN